MKEFATVALEIITDDNIVLSRLGEHPLQTVSREEA